MNRREKIDELKQITCRAIPTFETCDLGLQFDYITGEGAGTSMGLFNKWPLLRFVFPDSATWKSLKQKLHDNTLTLDDFSNTTMNNITEVISAHEPDSMWLSSVKALLSFPFKEDSYIYCFMDYQSLDRPVQFFLDEDSIALKFKETYCNEIIEWDLMSDDEISEWYDRSKDDLSQMEYAE